MTKSLSQQLVEYFQYEMNQRQAAYDLEMCQPSPNYVRINEARYEIGSYMQLIIQVEKLNGRMNLLDFNFIQDDARSLYGVPFDFYNWKLK